MNSYRTKTVMAIRDSLFNTIHVNIYKTHCIDMYMHYAPYEV